MLTLIYIFAYHSTMKSKQIIGHIMVATGDSITALAAQKGYTKQALYDVIKGRTRTKHLRKMISKLINKPVGDIWPEPAQDKTETRPSREQGGA